MTPTPDPLRAALDDIDLTLHEALSAGGIK